MHTSELEGKTFTCLEGCGFCCTFQPEVSTRELALLRARFKPQPVPVVVGDGRTYLALHNRCGACALLSAKACTAYDVRPAHCRYFPFHVYFGDESEAYVNYTCRGVERAQGDLRAAFDMSVTRVAKSDEIREHDEQAKATYAEFYRRAKRAGKWGDVAKVVREAIALGPSLLTGAGVERAAQLSGTNEFSRDDFRYESLASFHASDVTKRPFYLAKDLKWLTFEKNGDGLRVLEMDEKGNLEPRGDVHDVAKWRDPPRPEAHAPYFASLLQRKSFAGSVYALVDDHDYEPPVEAATWWRIAEVASDLSVRDQVLRSLGIPDASVGDETARFYDSTFLDAPTIGGWL